MRPADQDQTFWTSSVGSLLYKTNDRLQMIKQFYSSRFETNQKMEPKASSNNIEQIFDDEYHQKVDQARQRIVSEFAENEHTDFLLRLSKVKHRIDAIYE